MQTTTTLEIYGGKSLTFRAPKVKERATLMKSLRELPEGSEDRDVIEQWLNSLVTEGDVADVAIMLDYDAGFFDIVGNELKRLVEQYTAKKRDEVLKP